MDYNIFGRKPFKVFERGVRNCDGISLINNYSTKTSKSVGGGKKKYLHFTRDNVLCIRLCYQFELCQPIKYNFTLRFRDVFYVYIFQQWRAQTDVLTSV